MAFVFCFRSVSRATELCALINQHNFPALCITSSLKQEERIAKYKQFKDFKARLLVTTDLMGRGIDVERVNVVFNYDMPACADSYLHRVGRAARFSTKGLAISFVSSNEDAAVLNQVQARFVLAVPALPDEIDTASYM